MKRTLIILGATVLWFGFGAPQVHAASESKFKQDVYPLDCVFEQVNDGSNQIVYVTPRECGRQINILLSVPEIPANLPVQSPVTVIGSGAFEPPDGHTPAPQLQPEALASDVVQSGVGLQLVSLELGDGFSVIGSGSADERRWQNTASMVTLLTMGSAVTLGFIVDMVAHQMYFSRSAIRWASLRSTDIARLIRRLRLPL